MEKTLTKAKKIKLVNEIIEFLMKNELFEDTCVYADNKRYRLEKTENKLSNAYGDYYYENNIDANDYIEYSNPDTVTLSFEGDFYHVINDYDDYNYKLQQQFSKIIRKYDLYYEQGHAWNLSLYFN